MPVLNFLGSVKFAIILLVLIAIASIAGTLIPQEIDNKVISTLQLNDIYHSYWYFALLILFILNICICSVKHIYSLSRSFNISPDTIENTKLNRLSFYEKTEIQPDYMDMKMLQSLIQYNLVRKLFYRPKHSSPDEGLYYYEKGRIGRLGPLVAHASIIIIIIGGIIFAFMGFKEHIRIPVGETASVPNSDLKVKAEDFSIDFYPETKDIKQYITKLSIIENEKSVLTKDIMENHPLRYRSLKFIQSGYEVIKTVGIEVTRNSPYSPIEEMVGEFEVDEGKSVNVPDTTLEVKVLKYFPDYVKDETGNISNRSSEPRNPAVLLELLDNNKSLGTSWRFLKYPSFEMSFESDYSLEFVSMYPSKYATVIQVSRDSGVMVIWIGSFLLIVGLFVSFYFSHKKIWVRLLLHDNKIVIEIAGTSHKNRSGFKKESRILSRLLQK